MKQPIVSCGVPAAVLVFTREHPGEKPRIVTGRDCPESTKMLGDCVMVLEKSGLIATDIVYADSSQMRNGLTIPDSFSHIVSLSVDQHDVLSNTGDFFRRTNYRPGLVLPPLLVAQLIRCLQELVVVSDKPERITIDDIMRVFEPYIKAYCSTEDPLIRPTLVRQLAVWVAACRGGRRLKLPCGKTIYVFHASVSNRMPPHSLDFIAYGEPRVKVLRLDSVFSRWKQTSA